MTGSHSIKVGFQDSFGPYRRYNNANADLYQTYQNLAPLRVTVLNTPLQVAEYLDSNLGIYGQDSWRLDKFTINFGVRFDYVKQHIVGQDAQVGRFANLGALQRHRHAGVERHLAAHVAGVRRVRQWQDGHSRPASTSS